MSEPTVVRIGIVYGGGSLAAERAALLVEATQLAIAHINAKGGVLGRFLEACCLDDAAADPTAAPPVVLMGEPSAASQPAAQALLAAGDHWLWCPLPVTSGWYDSYCIHTGPCPNQVIEPALDWLQQQNRHRLYYLASDTELGRAFGRLLEAQLPTSALLGTSYLPLTTRDFTGVLAQARQLGAQAILSAIAAHQAALYADSRQVGLDPQELPIVALLPPDRPHQARAAAGHYGVIHSYPSASAEGAAFAERFGLYQDGTLEAAYLQVHLWAQAVELAGTFAGDRVRAAALGLHGRAPSGLVQLEANLFLSRPTFIVRERAGQPPELIWRSRRPVKPLPWLGQACSDRNADLAIAARELNQVRSDNQALAQQLHKLEVRFAERTSALAEANDQLVGEIVERRQAEIALRAIKNQLEAILSAVPGIVSWISADRKYLGVNQELADLFGLSPEDFIGQDIGFLGTSAQFTDFITMLFTSDRDEATCEIANLIAGEMRTFLLVAQKYDDGEAAFIIGIDITERQRALQELARSKDQLQAVLDAVPGIVSWISSDLRYLGVNRHLANTFGLAPEDFINQDIGFLQASDEFNQFVRDFFASEATDDFREVETNVQGETRNYLIAARKYDQGRAAFVVGIDITARQRALQALRQAENKYRNIFENAVEGIFQISLDGRYLSANPALARIYGYESPAVLIENLTNIGEQLYVEPERRAEFLRQLLEGEGVVGFESQIYRQDGTKIWISENARAVRDDQGNLLYFEGTVEDIHERKQAELALKRLNENLEERVQQRTSELQQLNLQLLMEIGDRERAEAALRTSEAELKALFAAMTDTITVFDSEGRYIKLVATNSELLYSPQRERIGRTVREVLPPEVAELFLQMIQRAIASQQTVNVEYSLPVDSDPDAPPSEAWFAAIVSPLPEQRVIWVARNITERRRVLKALQEAEEKYRSIFEHAAEGIFQTTPDGQFLSANPALVKMYGYDSFEDLVAHVTNIDTQLYLEPDLRASLRERLEREDAVSDFLARVWRKDGRVIWTSENVRVVRDETGKIRFYEGTVADITKRKHAEDALRAERETSERLLLNVLPRTIAERLKRQEQAIAERFDDVSILFADIADFTALSAKIPPTDLVGMLNEIFSSFDQLVEQHGLEKIKTIGDAYMVAGGLPEPNADHPEAIANLALDMQREIAKFRRRDGERFYLRIGINTGPVVAGVIGLRKFIYDLWGDTVNIASRMEAQGARDSIQVTAAVYERLRDRYRFEERGEISVKGRGSMRTYWLLGRSEPQ